MDNNPILNVENSEYWESLVLWKEAIYNFKDAFSCVEQVHRLLDWLRSEWIKPIFRCARLPITPPSHEIKNGDILFPKDMVWESCFIVSKNLSSYLEYYKEEISSLLEEKTI